MRVTYLEWHSWIKGGLGESLGVSVDLVEEAVDNTWSCFERVQVGEVPGLLKRQTS